MQIAFSQGEVLVSDAGLNPLSGSEGDSSGEAAQGVNLRKKEKIALSFHSEYRMSGRAADRMGWHYFPVPEEAEG